MRASPDGVAVADWQSNPGEPVRLGEEALPTAQAATVSPASLPQAVVPPEADVPTLAVAPIRASAPTPTPSKKNNFPAAGPVPVYVPSQVAAMLPGQLQPSAQLRAVSPAPRAILHSMAFDQGYPASSSPAVPKVQSLPVPQVRDPSSSPWDDFFDDEDKRPPGEGADPSLLTPAGKRTPQELKEIETQGPPLPPGDESSLHLPIPSSLKMQTNLADGRKFASTRES